RSANSEPERMVIQPPWRKQVRLISLFSYRSIAFGKGKRHAASKDRDAIRKEAIEIMRDTSILIRANMH
ncbi:MAG TPA: hypothetical protein VI958_08680, partial [Acidobacteriota bacterium]